MHRPFNEQETADAESDRRIGDTSAGFLKIQADPGAADPRRPGESRQGGGMPATIKEWGGNAATGERTRGASTSVESFKIRERTLKRDHHGITRKQPPSADALVCGDHADRPCTCVFPSMRRQSRPSMDDMQSADHTPAGVRMVWDPTAIMGAWPPTRTRALAHPPHWGLQGDGPDGLKPARPPCYHGGVERTDHGRI